MNTQTVTPDNSTTTTQKAGNYTIDASHSHVGFSVRHLMVSNVRGAFHGFKGTVAYDPARPEATKLDVSIEVSTIDTREPKRDDHLRSADFFDAEKFPSITFVSKSAKARSGGIDVVGDLSIRGTKREVTLVVEDIAADRADPWGNLRTGATAKTKIKRSDFGVTWNAALEAGGVVVGDDITITIEAELIRDK